MLEVFILCVCAAPFAAIVNSVFMNAKVESTGTESQQVGVVGHGRAPKDLVAEIRLKGQWV